MSTSPHVRRTAGLALLVGAALAVVVEAVVASAWTVRPYSYWSDNIAYLGSPDVGAYRGTVIGSPLWPLMMAAWVGCGVLAAVAAVLLARGLPSRLGRALRVAGVVEGVGLVVFALAFQGPTTERNGLLAVHYVGVVLAPLGGCALAVLGGVAARRLGLPRWLGVLGIVLGAGGAVAAGATFGWLALGAAERITIYAFLLWQLLAGVVLLAGSGDRATAPATREAAR